MLVSMAPVTAQPADGAAVDAPCHRFELGQDFHGADLRRAGDGAARKGRAQQVGGGAALLQAPGHDGFEVVDGRVALRAQSAGTSTDPGRHTFDRSFRSRSTIITFSARSFSLASSSSASRRSSAGVRSPGPCPLDRPGLHPAVGVHAQEPLGRGARHRKAVSPEEGGERRRIHRGEPPVEFERIAGPRRLEALRQVGLENVAGEDVLPDPLHRPQILVASEPGLELGWRAQARVARL